jgi:DNA adenine methylase
MANTHDTPRSVQPFLRWAGGKRWLATEVSRLLPNSFNNYFEPFLGGGSVFFSMLPASSYLSDVSRELIDVYLAVRDYPEKLIEIVSEWPNTPEQYYSVRSSRPSNPVAAAARVLYLNRTCWNGLYRVNRRGEFNVPYGRTAGRKLLDEPNLFLVSRALAQATLTSHDFEIAIEAAGEGDFVYLDPPYTAMHSTNGFRRYNDRIFSWEDQVRLAAAAQRLKSRGCYVVVSNASHAEVRELYPGFSALPLSRKSLIAGNPRYRSDTGEVLLVANCPSHGRDT